MERNEWDKCSTMVDSTCRAEIPSLSKVLTWETILSSTQRTVMGTLAPHLSQRALIPHFSAITPVRFEFGVITPGFASMILGWCWSWLNSIPSTKASELNLLKKKKWKGDTDGFVVVVVVVVLVLVAVAVVSLRREMRPLDNADMAEERAEWRSEEEDRWRFWSEETHTRGFKLLRPRLNLFTKLTFSMWIVGGSLVKIWASLFLGFGLGWERVEIFFFF